MEPELGIVYVLTNPAMPGLVKIGKTSRAEVEIRLNELYSTGVPVPFECAYAAKVANMEAVERAFHQAFGPYRINAKREFFQIERDQAIALLKLMAVEDVTPSIVEEANKVDTESKEASKKLQRRPNMNYSEMGIPVGSILHFTQGEETVEVVSDRKVRFRGEETSITAATRKLVTDGLYSVAPAPFWTYNGKTLREIYNSTYDEV